MKLFIILCIVVVVYARGKSECELHREREQQNQALGRLVPKCEANGDYKGLQCHEGTQYCQCWTKEGHPITAPSKKLSACECHREKHLAEENDAIGVFMPSCEDDGYYSKKQCWASTGMCWCADKNGKKVTEATRDHVDC